MNYKKFRKTEAIRWRQFTRRGDAIFQSLGKEIRIGVLSVATLSVACPNSAVAMMAMSQRPASDEETTALAAESPQDDDLLTLSALQHGDLLFCVASVSSAAG